MNDDVRPGAGQLIGDADGNERLVLHQKHLHIVQHLATFRARRNHLRSLPDNSEGLQATLERKGIPFIILTGYPRVLVRRDVRQRVLSKPISPEVLASTVRSLSRA